MMVVVKGGRGISKEFEGVDGRKEKVLEDVKSSGLGRRV